MIYIFTCKISICLYTVCTVLYMCLHNLRGREVASASYTVLEYFHPTAGTVSASAGSVAPPGAPSGASRQASPRDTERACVSTATPPDYITTGSGPIQGPDKRKA